MSVTRAVVVDPSVPERLVVRDISYPTALPSEALVRVKAISLNRGEVRTASSAEAGWRPGWDLAGIVEEGAADSSGPRAGSRGVGMLSSGSWAELPESVSFAQAATLPIAGLTALWMLERGGLLLDRLVLIVGVSGGVGHFACQLAKHAGARVIGVVRQPDHEAMVKDMGVNRVVVSEDLVEAREFGPYDLNLESVGGRSLGMLLLCSHKVGCVSTLGLPRLNGTISQRDQQLPLREVQRADLPGMVELLHDLALRH